jgi:hypothetical protein
VNALLALVLVWTVLIPVVVIAVSLVASHLSTSRRRPASAREAAKVIMLDSYRGSSPRPRRGSLIGQRTLRG